MNEDKIILDLCGGSSSWSKFYKDAGYDVRVITLPQYNVLETEFSESCMVFHSDNMIDVPMKVYYKDVYGILAAPPCTEFSRAKENMPRDLEGAMTIVNACLDIAKHCNPIFHALENPVGYLSKFLGKPQYTFHPWQFGDAWTKRTGLWGNFNEPLRTFDSWEGVPKIKELYIRPGRKKPSITFLHKSAIQYIPQFSQYNPKTDADFRAITPPGFAKAFFEANR
jgi:hypothetical protein